jgi:hypothetical protein
LSEEKNRRKRECGCKLKSGERVGDFEIPLWIEKNGEREETRTPDVYRVNLAPIGFTTTYKAAGTAKVRGSRIRHCLLWVGLWVGLGQRRRLSFSLPEFNEKLGEKNPQAKRCAHELER